MHRTRIPHLLAALLTATTLAPPTLPARDTAALDESIRLHRMGTIVIEARPGTRVHVEQLRHEFWFGCALASQAFDGSMNPADAARYKAAFLQKFNCAVTENALKWLDMEPERGAVNYATVDAILAWCDRSGLPLRGHNIYWGSPQWVQPWLKSLDDDALRAALKARGEDIARRYRGRFAEYDLNNEMIHGDYYADRLGPGITREMAGWVLAADPDAKLWVNDYDILTGRRLADYVAHIGQLQADGIPIAGIGVQGHLHGDTFDPAALKQALDELAKFDLPIRITEFNFPGQRSKFHENRTLPITPEEEEAKARALVDYYRICFAHPAVSGILMWGFWEGANWIPQSSLYRRDWSPTPAAIAYHNLVYRAWWTNTGELRVDRSGRLEVPAFFGTHRITAGRRTETITLNSTDRTTTITLR